MICVFDSRPISLIGDTAILIRILIYVLQYQVQNFTLNQFYPEHGHLYQNLNFTIHSMIFFQRVLRTSPGSDRDRWFK